MAAKTAPAPWRSRIVGTGTEAPDQLVANPRNWRTHPGPQRDALRGSLDSVGWVQQVMVNRVTGHVVDGHARVEEALSRGEPEVPVLYVELTPDEEALVLATLDPIGAMASTDKRRLEELLAEVQTEDSALAALLAGLDGSGIDLAARMNEWAGMPTYEPEFAEYKQLVVHFASAEDYEAFASLIGRALTPQTRAIWFPEEGDGRSSSRTTHRFGE